MGGMCFRRRRFAPRFSLGPLCFMRPTCEGLVQLLSGSDFALRLLRDGSCPNSYPARCFSGGLLRFACHHCSCGKPRRKRLGRTMEHMRDRHASTKGTTEEDRQREVLSLEACSPRTVVQRFVLCVLLLAISLVAWLANAPDALAATWPLSVSKLSPSVRFHDTYTAGDKSYAHSGIDIPASAGLQISSPLAGKVRYTGAVPSGDSRVGSSGSGPTMQAASIELADGRIVTLMPLASCCVSEGETVGEGQTVGVLAGTGDPSSSGAHLHMGLRKGGRYYDPMTLFGAPSTSAPAGDSSTAPAAAPNTSVLPSVAVPALSDEGGAMQTQQGAPRESPLAEPSYEPGIITSGEAAMPAPEEEPGLVGSVRAALEPLVQSCLLQARGLAVAFESLSQLTGIPIVLLATAAVLMGIGVIALLIMAAVRVAMPKVRTLWRRRASSLLSGKADGIMP